MNADQTKDLMTLLFAAWTTQRQRMTPDDAKAMYAAYAAGLGDLDFAIARPAIERLVRTSKWIPSVAEIREAAGIVVHGLQTPGLEAWGSVARAVREQGSHRTPGIDFVFRDPITALVVRSIGWLELCASDLPDHVRARFIDAYEQSSKNERVTAQASAGGTSKVLPIRGEARPLKENVELLLEEVKAKAGKAD